MLRGSEPTLILGPGAMRPVVRISRDTERTHQFAGELLRARITRPHRPVSLPGKGCCLISEKLYALILKVSEAPSSEKLKNFAIFDNC
jgi:hypothetical protein